MRLRRFAAPTPRPYFKRAGCPISHIHRPTRDRAHRRQSEHPHRVGLPRVEYRSEQHDGRAAENQTQSSHLNQSPDCHDSLSPSQFDTVRSIDRATEAAPWEREKRAIMRRILRAAQFRACGYCMKSFAKRESDAKREGSR
jgi:hypothetical protein